MNQKKSFSLILLCLFLLSSCKNYSVSLNDNTIYTPAEIFKDFQIADVALSDCVTQTLYDQKITSAEGLTRLSCTNAGIKSLAGLEKFFALVELNLNENLLNSIDEINQLGRLEVLYIAKNRITSSAPLLNLLHLRSLDISYNPIQDCANLQQVQKNLAHNKTLFILDAVCKKSG